MTSQHDDDEDELLSTPTSVDLVDDPSPPPPPRNESSNELSLLGEGLVSSGKSPGDIAEFLSDTAGVLMPRLVPPTTVNDSSIGSAQSRNAPGRPPRAPMGSHGSFRGGGGGGSGGKQPGITTHRNVPSTGDYSFLSALTDGSSPENSSHDGRGRSVSFDRHVFGQQETSEAILQPVLSDGGDDMPFPESIMTGPSGPSSHGQDEVPQTSVPQNDNPMREQVNLNDIIGASPLEAEAETAILRVLEEEELDREDPAETRHILPHLSDEDARAFQREEPSKEALHVAVPENVDRVKVDSVRSSLRASVTGLSKKAGHSIRTAATKEESRMRESKGLEHKLIGLTLAMNRLRAQSEARRSVLEEQAREAEGGNEEEEDLHTSELFAEDAMVANANRLFRRKIGRQEGSLHLKGAAAAGRTHTAGHKKTDSDIGSVQGGDDEIDVELGHDVGAPDVTEDEPQKTLAQFFTGLFVKPVKQTARRTGDDVMDFGTFLSRKRRGIMFFTSVIVFGLMIPLLGVAALLYYALDNPLLEEGGASVSWILIFVARQLLMLALALASQLFTIDYLSLRRRLTVKILGSWASLGLVQSKGYPFLLVSWSFYSFCLLSGTNRFAQHWLFWQDSIDMFNAKNPSGNIASSHIYLSILGMAMFNGIVIALKRLWWGLYVGKKSYIHFGDQVAKTIERMVLISEVSHLSVLCARKKSTRAKIATSMERGFAMAQYYEDSTRPAGASRKSSMGSTRLPATGTTKPYSEYDKIIDEAQKDKRTGRLTQSQRTRMNQLLEAWEEPEVVRHKKARVSINAILEFRQALTFMDSDFVFSLSFGLANSRVACIESSQRVFERLLMATPGRREIPFETIAVLATDEDDGLFDQAKMKSLIRLFRPGRDGVLTLLEWVKSTDQVYKDMRMLRASVKNAGQIDHSYEIIVNWFFFMILGIITVAVLGYDPLALFLSLSSIILAFAFMISSASSKYFEGLLFVLVRKPYDIGDRIHVSNVNSDTSAGGSSTCRIINGRRSPKAVRFVYMKFGVNIPYQKVQLFKRSVETFVKDRPREWLSLAGFRATHVEQDKGFIEYVIVLQHRESWQNIGPILNSTADVSSFCLELAKKLGMRYTAPPLPVNLTMRSDAALPSTTESTLIPPGDVHMDSPNFEGMSPEVRAIASMFKKRGGT